MQDNSFEVFVALLAGIVLFFIMSGFVVFIVIIHRQRQVKNRYKMEILKADYEKTILDVQKEIREETLHYVSQELHDNIGQMLSLTKLMLNSPDPSSAQEGKRMINQVIKEVRSLSKSINRDYIRDVKFLDFLSEELDKIQRSGYCKTVLETSAERIDIPDESKKLILIRLVQECLNNAIKHAEASAIRIKVDQEGSKLNLEISDDGVGFDISDDSNGLGLKNLHSRMSTIDGELDIKSAPKQGTSIKMSVEV